MKSSHFNILFVAVVFSLFANCANKDVNHAVNSQLVHCPTFKSCTSDNGKANPMACPCETVCVSGDQINPGDPEAQCPAEWHFCVAKCNTPADCHPGTTCIDSKCIGGEVVTEVNDGTCSYNDRYDLRITVEVESSPQNGVSTCNYNGICEPSLGEGGSCEDCPSEFDQDGDGYPTPVDCDDNNPLVHPGADEICGDGVDNDCDGETDEADCVEDKDEDGYEVTVDCNDNDPDVHPDAPEVCGNDVDDNCDGLTDEGCLDDNDNDSYTADVDCDDNDPHTFPGAPEVCDDGKDNDCDGETDENCPKDEDGDGWNSFVDCDDHDATVYPGATEVCDGKDNDCDGQTDEISGCDPFEDADGDGFTSDVDCDDNDPNTHPGAVEVCDGKDNNCNGFPDEGEVCVDDHDFDNDGYDAIPWGYDCDDSNPLIHPGAPELCGNGVDDDCDGIPDNNCMECGNGVQEGNEKCDGLDLNGASCQTLGYDSGTLFCNSNCTFNVSSCQFVQEYCGDGVRNGTEDCDGPDLNGLTCQTFNFDYGTLGCTLGCEFSFSNCHVDPVIDCGDNVRNGNEQCDGADFDGQTCQDFDDYDGGVLLCNSNCTLNFVNCTHTGTYCGDGIRNGTEQCDGPDLSGFTCQMFNYDYGALSCNQDCTLNKSNCFNDQQPYCGDGVRNDAEQCDDGDTGGFTCQTFNYDYGVLGCTSLCEYDFTNCHDDPITPHCGDGERNTVQEQCDGSDLGGFSCQLLNYDYGVLTCSSNCTFNTSSCYDDVQPFCGDGDRNGNEQCDGLDLGGFSCQLLNYDYGTLLCKSNCTFDVSSCQDEQSSYCGDGDKDPNEACDGADLDGKDCQNFGYDYGVLSCNSNCTFDDDGCHHDEPQPGASDHVAKPCEGESYCLELNGKYLDYSIEVYVVGDCPPLGLYDYNGVYESSGRIQVFDTDNDGYYELHWNSSTSWDSDCEISYFRPDPNQDNDWSWAQYEGWCLSSSDPFEFCGEYLNCGYNGNGEYVCNVHFEVPSGDPTGDIEYCAQYPSTW